MRRALPVLLFLAIPARGSGEPILPPRFEDISVIEDLSDPVAVRFDAQGSIFVAEKAGRIKLFDPHGGRRPTCPNSGRLAPVVRPSTSLVAFQTNAPN